jgi:uncharacterized protein (TIGR00369 family)
VTTAEEFNTSSTNRLPGYLGIVITSAGAGVAHGELAIRDELMAVNGYLHAGTVVTLADTCAGAGCLANLPDGATGFTTIELKSNHVGTARDGTIECTATLVHAGRMTQVWDAIVTHRETRKAVAVFRCTQMILYPR